MNCPKCNFEIPEGTFFCGECGTKIEVTPSCKKCGTPLKGGVLFCPNCGTSASTDDGVGFGRSQDLSLQTSSEVLPAESAPEAELQVEEAPKAEAENPHPALDNEPVLTVKSKEDIEENLERTMTIPIIKQGAYRPAEKAPEHINPRSPVNPVAAPDMPKQASAPRMASKASPVPRNNAVHPAAAAKAPAVRQAPSEPNVRRTKEQPSKNNDGQTQKNILIFLIVFLLVILIGLLSIILVMSLTKDDSTSGTAPGETQSAAGNESEQKEESDSKEEESGDEENKKDKDNKDKKNSSSSLLPEDYIVKVDYDFDFAFGEDLDPDDHSIRRYMIHEDTEYFFECDVPSGFKNVFSDDAEVRYSARDNTAYMDIGAYYNDAGLSVEDVMDNTESSLGTSASYEASGDDWFALSLEKDGVVYYQKCFVDDEYIRYFEFAYPAEYSDIYENYIDDIESNYKRTE